jgi:hypothetical protein
MSLDTSRFAPVSLDDLVSEAALLTRVDRKYVVDLARARRALAALPVASETGAPATATRVLEIDGVRDFQYESTYFDTPDLVSFHMAAHPRRRRIKVRTRSYLDTGDAFLEIKTKGARGQTVKERTAYDLDRRHELTDDVRDEVGRALDAIGVDPERVDDLGATLVTHYRRTTLLQPDGAARATIDTDLAWVAADGETLVVPGMVIVETKSGQSASPLDRALWRVGARPVSVSKYATGLAALRGDLPHNHWARLLRGPFAHAIRLPAGTRPDEISSSAA